MTKDQDARIHPRMKLLAELLLQRIDGIIPPELIDSILREQYGSPSRMKVSPEGELNVEDVLDKKVSKELKQQWKEMLEEEDDTTASINTTNQ